MTLNILRGFQGIGAAATIPAAVRLFSQLLLFYMSIADLPPPHPLAWYPCRGIPALPCTFHRILHFWRWCTDWSCVWYGSRRCTHSNHRVRFPSPSPPLFSKKKTQTIFFFPGKHGAPHSTLKPPSRSFAASAHSSPLTPTPRLQNLIDASIGLVPCSSLLRLCLSCLYWERARLHQTSGPRRVCLPLPPSVIIKTNTQVLSSRHTRPTGIRRPPPPPVPPLASPPRANRDRRIIIIPHPYIPFRYSAGISGRVPS